jgi:hypothetical protein
MAYPGIGEDVSDLMGGDDELPSVGGDVSHLMGGPSGGLYDPARRPVSAEDFTAADQPQGSALGRFASGAWDMLNPVTMVKGAAHAIAHPIDTTESLLGAQVGEYKKAKENFSKGRISEGLGHSLATVLPLLGPAAAAAGEQIGTGDVAGGLGKAAGMLAPFVVGDVVPGRVSTPAVMRNANPMAADAVEYGLREGLPIDAGTATGNRFIKAIQHVSDRSLGGSLVAGKAATRQGEGLATLGEQLAAKGYASPVSTEQAGDAVRDAVMDQIRTHAQTADAGYNTLRRIEANPAHARPVRMPDGHTEMMPLPVDIQSVRASLRPVYDSLSHQAQIAPAAMMGDKARALVALDKLMKGPTHAPLSVVDGLLSDLKSFSRTDVPELKTAGQGAIAETVKHLDRVVRNTAANAGPLAEAALRTGREATIAKYGAADVLDSLHAEPVKTIQRLTAPKDTAIDQLRAVAKQAPQALPQIGRAYLDNLLTHATSEGGFGHAQAIGSTWEKLGTQTKLTLYKDPAYVKDLDRFFQLAKMTGETPNPSGTAHTLLSAGQGGLILTNPVAGVSLQVGTAALSSLLHSPAGVKLLTRGMILPIKNKVAAAAWLADLTNAGIATSPSGSPSGLAQSPGR